MIPMLEHLRTEYEKIPIPEELDKRVDQALRTGKRRSWVRFLSKVMTPFVAACVIFVVAINSNYVFASALYEIPVLGDLCRMVTFREYQEETQYSVTVVRIPKVDVSAAAGNTAWVDEINDAITQTIETEVSASKERAEEYFEAYLETGGDPETFHPIHIDVDYALMYTDENLLSFVIYKTETLASAYQENYYYNVDLKTGKSLKIQDFLGENWVDRVEAATWDVVEKMPQDDQRMFFILPQPTEEGDEHYPVQNLREVIERNIGWYLNDAGTVVVVYPKYSIAAGAMGLIEVPVSQ